MERTTSIAVAKKILGINFIGPEELTLIADKMGIEIPSVIPVISFSLEELINKQKDYLLILGISQMKNGVSLTIKSLRDRFGINPDISEPCFYNQDWYLNERFIERNLENKWYLVRKNVFDESRGKNPDNMEKHYSLPTAIICAFAFFTNNFVNKGELLWEHDFIWCKDIDCNGDRIYVGKYHDIKEINKNGFSIHRHLSIRNNYGSIEVF